MKVILFFVFSQSMIFGFDIGTNQIRVSYVNNNQQIVILKDKSGERDFFTVLSIKSNENLKCDNDGIRNFDNLIFSFGKDIEEQFSAQNIIQHWTNFFAKSYTNDLMDIIKDRNLDYHIQMSSSERIFMNCIYPEVLYMMALDNINESIINILENYKIDHVGISVPKFYPQLERETIKGLSKAKGFRASIVDNTKAISIYFALENFALFRSKPINVAFVDIGASNSQFFIVRFEKRNGIFIKEKSYSFDDSAAGRDIDIVIRNIIANQTDKFIDLKIENKLISEARKIKHQIPIRNEFKGYIEGHGNISGFSYSLNVSTIIKLSEPILSKIIQIIRKASGENQIDRVQLIGGSCRLPFIQEVIKKELKTKNLFTSMNMEEANTIGASYYSATLSNEIKLPRIEYESIEYYHLVLRTHHEQFPFTGSFPWYNDFFWVFQTNNSFPSGSSPIAVWGYAENQSKIRITNDGIIKLVIPGKKILKPWKSSIITQYTKMKQRHKELMEIDVLFSQLEQLLVDTRFLLKETGSNLLKPIEIENVNEVLRSIEFWFHMQKQYHPHSLQNSIAVLKSHTHCLFGRYQNNQMLELSIQQFHQDIEEIYESLFNMSFKSKRKLYRSGIRTVLKSISAAQLWFNERMVLHKATKMTDDPLLVYYRVNEISSNLKRVFQDYVVSLNDREQSQTNYNSGHYFYSKGNVNIEID